MRQRGHNNHDHGTEIRVIGGKNNHQVNSAILFPQLDYSA